MSRLQKKAEARTKQIVGQMLGDDQLVDEGKNEERHADGEVRREASQDEEKKK